MLFAVVLIGEKNMTNDSVRPNEHLVKSDFSQSFKFFVQCFISHIFIIDTPNLNL